MVPAPCNHGRGMLTYQLMGRQKEKRERCDKGKDKFSTMQDR
jgi:hypothetical protein